MNVRLNSAPSLLRNVQIERQILASNNQKLLRRVATFTVIALSVLMIWILWLKMGDMTSIVLNHAWLSELTVKERFLYDIVPFQLRNNKLNQLLEIILNAFVFAPYGLLLNYTFEKKSIPRDLCICFFFSLFIELLQLFTSIGAFATSDLIMNTLGYFIGLAFYKLIFASKERMWMIRFYLVVDALIIAAIAYALNNIISNIDLLKMLLWAKM